MAYGRVHAMERQSEATPFKSRLRPPPPPPPLNLAMGNELQAPQRSKHLLGRRESRMGLRNIFGRAKANKATEESNSPRQGSHPVAIRSSVLDPNNWPHTEHERLSDATLSPIYDSRPLSLATEEDFGSDPSSSQKSFNEKPKKSALSSKPSRSNLASWDAPPLFKAYPQAIKYSTLPASTLSTETILKLHEKRLSESEGAQQDGEDEQFSGKDKRKKKSRRGLTGSEPTFEWTTKTYILATSGCLLRYSADGPFDRLPEKVLQLGKTSAAFASDVIPGKHWVLQISSSVDADGTAAPDSRSLFSRLPFRASDRRHTPNFLMVFETAEDMDAWLSTLRREIEGLGGKRNLSETGKPKEDLDRPAALREQSSQRTLVVRDPDRYSTAISQDLSLPDGEEGVSMDDMDAFQDHTVDDMSTTNSTVSQDGRQLENLRDSANRLSFISSGQRTVVTSAGSSPACSPTVDTFPGHIAQTDSARSTRDSALTEAKPRPNASAIINRRQSLQTMGQFVDNHGRSDHSGQLRPQSTMLPSLSGERTVSGAFSPPPNFSVPQSSNRRFSYVKTASVELTQSIQSTDSQEQRLERSSRSPGMPQRSSRPLSMVTDLPSPREYGEVMPERPATRHGEANSDKSPSNRPTVSFTKSLPRNFARSREASYRLSLATPEPLPQSNTYSHPRRLSSLNALHKSDHGLGSATPLPHGPVVQDQRLDVRVLHSMQRRTPNRQPERCRSSLDLYETSRSRSPVPTPANKRASMISIVSDTSQHERPTNLQVPGSCEPLPQPAPPPTAPLPPIPTSSGSRRRVNPRHQANTLLSRRSMPQLSEGPPPMPPPSCALPPIPQRAVPQRQLCRT